MIISAGTGDFGSIFVGEMTKFSLFGGMDDHLTCVLSRKVTGNSGGNSGNLPLLPQFNLWLQRSKKSSI